MSSYIVRKISLALLYPGMSNLTASDILSSRPADYSKLKLSIFPYQRQKESHLVESCVFLAGEAVSGEFYWTTGSCPHRVVAGNNKVSVWNCHSQCRSHWQQDPMRCGRAGLQSRENVAKQELM